jgi:type IV secretion system protein VirB4
MREHDLGVALNGVVGSPSRRVDCHVFWSSWIPPTRRHVRAAKWCEKEKGDYGWVFDNREDQVVGLLDGAPLIGFDVTDFLDNEATRDPVTMYLFHIVRGLLDGRRLVVWMDEFSKLLSDRSFEAFAKDGLRTWRKLEGVAVFATQSRAMCCRADRTTWIEQAPTNLLPECRRRPRTTWAVSG